MRFYFSISNNPIFSLKKPCMFWTFHTDHIYTLHQEQQKLLSLAAAAIYVHWQFGKCFQYFLGKEHEDKQTKMSGAEREKFLQFWVEPYLFVGSFGWTFLDGFDVFKLYLHRLPEKAAKVSSSHFWGKKIYSGGSLKYILHFKTS